MKTDAEMEGPLCKPGNTELCKGTEAEGQTGNTLSSEPRQGPTPTDTLTLGSSSRTEKERVSVKSPF